jgi:hypothetical protein
MAFRRIFMVKRDNTDMICSASCILGHTHHEGAFMKVSPGLLPGENEEYHACY